MLVKSAYLLTVNRNMYVCTKIQTRQTDYCTTQTKQQPEQPLNQLSQTQLCPQVVSVVRLSRHPPRGQSLASRTHTQLHHTPHTTTHITQQHK